MGTTRNDVSEPFGEPFPHPTIPPSGPEEYEAPTLVGNDKLLYYHCRPANTEPWRLCFVERR